MTGFILSNNVISDVSGNAVNLINKTGVELTVDFTLNSENTLTMNGTFTFQIKNGATFTNNGSIKGSDTIYLQGENTTLISKWPYG